MYVLYISLQIIPIYGDEGKKGENICTNDIRIIYIYTGHHICFFRNACLIVGFRVRGG